MPGTLESFAMAPFVSTSPDINAYDYLEKLKVKICDELNQMECRPQRQQVVISGSLIDPSNEGLKVEVQPRYSDHPLVVGPRYIPKRAKIGMGSSYAYYYYLWNDDLFRVWFVQDNGYHLPKAMFAFEFIK